MKIAIIAALGLAAAFSQQASAAVAYFSFSGVVEGSEFGAAAAADIFAVAPVGSTYGLTFSYDTATAPTFGGPTYGSYSNVPVSAVFTLGGTAFSIPTANIATGSGPFGGALRFSLFNNNVPFSAARIAGYQLLDFSFTLFDLAATELTTGALPTSFDLVRFAPRSVRPRFALGPNGSTALTLSVDMPAAGGVPEPRSWALLIAGFGMVGMAMRRRAAGPVAAG